MDDYYDTQYWLAELDRYGNPTLVDGAHSERNGAEQAWTIIKALGLPSSKKECVIAEVRLSKPNGIHDPINQDAIDTLNGTSNLGV